MEQKTDKDLLGTNETLSDDYFALNDYESDEETALDREVSRQKDLSEGISLASLDLMKR